MDPFVEPFNHANIEILNGTTSEVYILLLSPSSFALRDKRSKEYNLSWRHMINEMRAFECGTLQHGQLASIRFKYQQRLRPDMNR